VNALRHVYNLTLPLALVLSFAGYITCGKFSLKPPLRRASPTEGEPGAYRWQFPCSWTLDLADLSTRGSFKIAHDASFVHPSGRPSHAPDPSLVSDLLRAAANTEKISPTSTEGDMSLRDLAALRIAREKDLPKKLSVLHEQIALGESGLAWLLLRNPKTGAIPADMLEQWFGEERLPRGWWESIRPTQTISLSEARSRAGEVQAFMKEIRLGQADVCR
jgi:hypothetical protein